MLNKLRERAQDEKGFTLIELLVVILIIGILAAIALPAFLGQRAKAQDTEAKTIARTAQTAMETWYTDSQTYTGADKPALVTIEPALNTPKLTTVTPTGTQGYTVTATSVTGNTFSVTKTDSPSSTPTRACTGTGGGCKNGSW
jgi:type IV pilus assembly protein PilA